MYLYLADENGYEELPQALREGFGTPSLIMTIKLAPDRKLARVDVVEVLDALTHQGYFLQMPPKLEPHMYYGE